jgi:hypothetical protein
VADIPAEAVAAAYDAVGYTADIPAPATMKRILDAAAPFLVADCLKAAAREQFEDAIAAATEEATRARLAEIEAAVRSAERERCVAEIFAYADEKLAPMIGATYRDAARVLNRRGQVDMQRVADLMREVPRG